MLEEE